MIETVNEKWVCFLNSHSKLRAPNWLKILHDAANEPHIGVVGATGSWSTWSFRNPCWKLNIVCILQYPVRLIMQVYKHIKYHKRYNHFPNFHIRSNAFLLKRVLFSEYCRSIEIPRTKSDTHMLESGRNGLSMFIQSKGLGLRVCGADGLSYKPSDWRNSRTFRIPQQTNLLVEDNQTRNYDNAGRYLKQRLEFASWGHCFS